MVYLFALNETLSRCPEDFPPDYLAYPSTAIVNGICAIAAFAISVFTMAKYNSVKVWDKSFSPLYISNTLWVIYYMAIFVRAACNTVRYSLPPRMQGNELEHVLFLTSLIIQGIGAFALSLTVNHQRRFRSSAPPAAKSTAGEKDALIGANTELVWFKAISPLEIIFSVLFLIYLVFLYLALSKTEKIYEILFFVAFALQRVPIIFLMVAIVAYKNSEGPTRRSKIVFLVAAVLHLVNDLPSFLWTHFLPHGCFATLNAVDGMLILNFIALILFFMFIRWEFLRNMEEVIWDKVNQIQTTFDFRRF